MNRLRQSVIGILAGVGLAVVAAAVLFAGGLGPGEPLPGPTNSDWAGEPVPEPAPSSLPEPMPTTLPDPDGGVPGPATTVVPSLPGNPADRPAVGYVVAGGGQTNVHATPSTASPVIATLPDNAVVYITCTTRGEIVSSAVTGLSSDLWDRTTDGGYIPDVAVDTGTNEPVKPECPA